MRSFFSCQVILMLDFHSQREESFSEKVSNCICHNNSNGFFAFQPHFLFPTKDFQKISEKQKGARCEGSVKTFVKKIKGQRPRSSRSSASSHPQEFFFSSPSNWPNES